MLLGVVLVGLFDGEPRKLMRVEGRNIEVVAEFLENLIGHDPR